ncbi:protealysin inhibitor emfourin [Cellulophaga baltica]|uniref:protealysin inhibitor emfourin n=1 Tax=Cellulophaga baltica TaxID=76594 RepID=UPI003F4AE428
MKYSLLISGGFTGIPKRYTGTITVASTEEKELLDILTAADRSENKNLRDGLQYHLKVAEGSENYEAKFDDANIPQSVRNLITKIIQKD